MAVRPSSDRSSAHWVDGVGEVLGMVLMDPSDEVAGLGPLAVSPAAQSMGVGRGLMVRCVEECRRRRIRSLRLVAIVANITSFSLYHSLGFRAYEYMVALHGHLTEARHRAVMDDMRAAGVSVRPMLRDDIAACNQLHIATNSVSRLAGLTFSFDSQPSQQQRQHKLNGSDTAHNGSDGLHSGSSDGPSVGCYVAVADSGAILGYCTGWAKSSH